jgi:hypothetical protein
VEEDFRRAQSRGEWPGERMTFWRGREEKGRVELEGSLSAGRNAGGGISELGGVDSRAEVGVGTETETASVADVGEALGVMSVSSLSDAGELIESSSVGMKSIRQHQNFIAMRYQPICRPFHMHLTHSSTSPITC